MFYGLRLALVDMVLDGCNCYFQFGLFFGTARKVVNSCFNCTSIPFKDNEPWSSLDELELQNNIDMVLDGLIVIFNLAYFLEQQGK